MKSIIILVAIIFILGVVNGTPKVENTAWNNLIEAGSDLEITGRSSSISNNDGSVQDFIENYIKSNEISFKLPLVGSTISIQGRNLDNEELGLKLKFGSGSEVEARKKSKIKKIFVPILIFILVKAMTLIPLALGVLSLKAWNAIQLSFVAFVTTVAMAVWKLCSKVNGDDHPHPQVIHEAFDPHHHHHHHLVADRNDQIQGMELAYSDQIPSRY